MDYSKALCRDLPREIKQYFFSYNVNELLKAVEVCKECKIKQDCYEVAISDWKTNGVWGGKILSRGQPVAESTIKARAKNNASIKFQWY